MTALVSRRLQFRSLLFFMYVGIFDILVGMSVGIYGDAMTDLM